MLESVRSVGSVRVAKMHGKVVLDVDLRLNWDMPLCPVMHILFFMNYSKVNYYF